MFIFYAIRVILGLFARIVKHTFISCFLSVWRTIGRYTSNYSLAVACSFFGSLCSKLLRKYTVLLSLQRGFMAIMADPYLHAGLGVILSTWPYIAVIFLPLSFDALYCRGPLKITLWGLKLILYVLVPMVLIDSFFYGKWVFTIYNIVHYNVFRANSVLYGVEDWKYYLINGFLNFSLCFPLALVSFGTCSDSLLRRREAYCKRIYRDVSDKMTSKSLNYQC